jgi:MFS family permease
MEDTIAPIIAIMFIIGGPIAAIIVWRVLAHQERMEMLRRGITPPPDPRTMRRAMKYGWQPGPMPGASQGPIPGPIPTMNPYGYDPNYYAQHQLRRGIQVAFVGLALLIGLSFIGYHGDGPPHYGPWLLGGLIPLFVGIAQVISAVMSGAQIGGGQVGNAQSFGPVPGPGMSAPPPGPSAAQAPSGPTGWRPGNIPEIEKPAGPPDYR